MFIFRNAFAIRLDFTTKSGYCFIQLLNLNFKPESLEMNLPNIILPLEIPSLVQTEDFKSHLNIKGNNRIIFSGRYGSGKTFFLKKFFQDKSDFNVFHLFPVNYQVFSNQDIFELIKLDILIKIIERGWIDETEQIPKKLAFQFYLYNKAPSILMEVLKNIPTYEVNIVSKSLSNLSKFISDFFSYHKEINNVKENPIEEFFDSLKNLKGHVYEFDAISEIITTALKNNRIDANGDVKENVLIIDDLDRIDPDQIFRILNIFSAHYDLTNLNENKFGFDKIIIVSDIENIRNIFFNKYGNNTDFEGYIDKFYSQNVFEFDLSNEILLNLDKLLDGFYNSFKSEAVSKVIRKIIFSIVELFIINRICSIRDLERFKLKNDPFCAFTIVNKEILIRKHQLFFPLIFDILESLFDNKIKLEAAFNKCLANANSIKGRISLLSQANQVIGNCALLSSIITNNHFKNSNNFGYHFDDYGATCINEEQDHFFTSNLSSLTVKGYTNEPTVPIILEFIKNAYLNYKEFKFFVKKESPTYLDDF